MANTTGLGDTIYAAVKKAINDAEGGSGGGGSSDLTTARVTLASSGEISPEIQAFFSACMTGEFQGLSFAAPYSMNQDLYLDLYFDVILYKGASLLKVAEGAPFSIVSTSGAIQQMDVGVYMITGDCTITIEDI